MTTDNQKLASALSELAGKLSMELVYAEPGKDLGLLPINFLLSQMEEACTPGLLPEEFQNALAAMRQTIEGVFESTGLFTEPAIKTLGEWSNWMESALEANQAGQNLPPAPAVKTEEESSAKPGSDKTDAPCQRRNESGINLAV